VCTGTFAPKQDELVLHRHEPRCPLTRSQLRHLIDPAGREVGARDLAHLADLDQLIERADGLLDRQPRVGYVQVIEIDMVRALTKANNARGWTESAWNSHGGAAGSGCSAWIAKPAWQTDANCPGRMVADIAADADPNTGPAVYDSHDGHTWTIVRGTSVSSPFITGVIGLAGNPGQFPDASSFYGRTSGLNDVLTGNNIEAQDCDGDYQCNAGPGYDGPTGNGTPNGLAAF
jgi:hypothetical protein